MSGVYIKGMEMPKDGAERCIVIRGDGSVSTFVGAPIDYVRAIPVPDHGRLVDAETAEKELDNLERTSRHNSVLWPDHVEECREALRGVPTVISADEGERRLQKPKE